MKQNETLPLKVRFATNEDIPFIFSSWLRSFREQGYLARAVPNTIYYQNHHQILQKLVKRSKVYIACNSNDVSQIYGYIVGEYIENALVIHYLYVKHSFRKLGVGKALFNSFDHDTSLAACCSHLTKPVEKFLMKYNVIYHPYTMLLDEPAVKDIEGAVDEID
jgi:GNAT superfamily N-acetyltransferase